MSQQPVYRILAALIGQHARCVESNNAEWRDKSKARINTLVSEHFPRGSGLDSGSRISHESTSEKLVFTTSFHHMNDGGFYDGWTEHVVTVRPQLEAPGYRLSISGRDRNDIKDHIHEAFDIALSTPAEQYPGTPPAPIDPAELEAIGERITLAQIDALRARFP